MQMRMEAEFLIPGMEDTGSADATPASIHFQAAFP